MRQRGFSGHRVPRPAASRAAIHRLPDGAFASALKDLGGEKRWKGWCRAPPGKEGGKVQQGISLPEILQSRAAQEPGKRACVFLGEHGEEEAVLTYGELYARALTIARHLARQLSPGDRALLLFPPGLDFIVAYFGCLYAHVIAVPVFPPHRDHVQDATRSIVTDCAPSAVLTISLMIDAIRPSLEPACGPVQWIALDRMEPGQPGAPGFRPQPSPADAIAFLQYTSGSTSEPKGVMVSHRNLCRNQEMIKHAFGHDQHSTLVGWTPFYHDQGLIGNVLQPLYLGATSILMSPLTFIRRPLLWLWAISRYRAHTSGGPNFAFDICVARAARDKVPDIDLSCWKVAFNGAEPIRPATLRRFSQTFAPFGFSENALYPCYGLAEATLIVTGSQKGRGPRTVEADADELTRRRYTPPQARTHILAGSGLVLPGEEIRIVDPETSRPCPADQAGEIWVSGEHVTQGYWRHPEATTATFRATCAGEPGRTYLRTGDLGIVIDGELYVIGRIKDLVIIRGRNYYPQDIEHTVQSAHPALKPGACAAFSVPAPAGEKLVIVQEIRQECLRSADASEIAASVREAVMREHQLSVGDLVLILPAQVEKTSSGKVRRAAGRKRYLEGGFEVWTSGAPSLV